MKYFLGALLLVMLLACTKEYSGTSNKKCMECEAAGMLGNYSYNTCDDIQPVIPAGELPLIWDCTMTP